MRAEAVFLFSFLLLFFISTVVCVCGGAIVIVLKLKVIQTFAYIIHMIDQDVKCSVWSLLSTGLSGMEPDADVSNRR